MQQSLAAVGMICEKNDALHLLTLLCVAPERIELQAPAAADALTAAGAFAGALGVPAPVWDEAMAVRLQEGGDSFRMVVGHYDLSIRKGCTKLIVAAPSLDEDADDAYQLAPWPVVALKAADGWKFTDLPACQPVKAAAVREAVMNGRTELPGESLQLLDQMAHLLEKEGAPLAQTVRRQMYEYLSCAAAHLEGGIADALDYAACAWIVPHMKRHGVSAEKAAELVQGLPRTRKLLER